MANSVYANPEKLYSAIKEGKKLAIFTVDEGKNAISFLSDVNFQKSQDLQKIVPDDDRILPAVKYISENYKKEIKLDFLADLCDVSKCYLCRLFQARFHMGVTEYVLALRINAACDMLVKTNSTVVSIAFDLGYADCTYFNRLFKKKTGLTPLGYRKKYRN